MPIRGVVAYGIDREGDDYMSLQYFQNGYTCWNYAFQTGEFHGGMTGISSFGYKEVSKELIVPELDHFIILICEKINGNMPLNYHYIRYDNGVFSAKEGAMGKIVSSKHFADMVKKYPHKEIHFFVK